MLDRISSELFTDWMVYFSMEPFTPKHEDARHDILCQRVLAAGGVKSKFSDHTPQFERQSDGPLTQEEINRQAQEAVAWALAEGATVITE